MSDRGTEGARLGHDSDAIAGFLPLVDVLLAVLCMTMVAAGRNERARTVPVDLPRAVGATDAPPVRPVRVTFDRGGRLWLDGTAIEVAELAGRLVGVVRDGSRVVIEGDASAEYATAVQVFQMMHDAGVTTASLLVEKAKRP